MDYRTSRFRIGREELCQEPREEDAAYTRWYRTMDAVFGATILLAIVLVLGDTAVPWGDRLVGSALVLFLVVWYWFRGQGTALRSDIDVVLYFAVLVIGLSLAIRHHDAFALILFAAYWQGFAYMRIPWSLVFATILTLASQWAFGNLNFGSFSGLVSNPAVVLITFIALVVSGLLASFIETISREADRRADLLKQLREAQAELATREREAGVAAERQRLAGEIHDTIAQQFTSIVTNLEAAELQQATNPADATAHLRNAQNAARQGIRDARSMLRALQPHVLEGRTISAALEQIVTEADAADGAKLQFREDGVAGSLQRLQESVLVRALQEALQNTRKHAGASHIDVTLSWLDDEVLLDVEDDGHGFDLATMPVAVGGHHLGLETMRRRVESAGGTWMIDSTPGEGTSLTISFPLDRQTEDTTDDIT